MVAKRPKPHSAGSFSSARPIARSRGAPRPRPDSAAWNRRVRHTDRCPASHHSWQCPRRRPPHSRSGHGRHTSHSRGARRGCNRIMECDDCTRWSPPAQPPSPSSSRERPSRPTTLDWATPEGFAYHIEPTGKDIFELQKETLLSCELQWRHPRPRGIPTWHLEPRRKADIEMVVDWWITLRAATSWQEIINTWVGPIQDLLTLLTLKPNRITRLTVTPPGSSTRVRPPRTSPGCTTPTEAGGDGFSA